MREILPDIDAWLARGEKVALATVVETWGSGPRQPGAKLALSSGGARSGSLSGGCVEDQIESALRAVLQTGRPAALDLRVEDPQAWDAGLPCGGALRLWLERLESSWFEPLRSALVEERSIAAVTVLHGPPELAGRKLIVGEDGSCVGSLGRYGPAGVAAAQEALARGRCQRCDWPAAAAATPPLQVLVEALGPPPTLIAVGGVSIGLALCALAQQLGYRTVLIDPTAAASDLPAAVDLLVPAWPEASGAAPLRLTSATAVAVLSQNPTLDEPALRAALSSPAFYVGALGGRASQTRRRQRLVAAGLSAAQIARLQAPIGLDLGGRGPGEVALGILAQITAARHGA